MVTTSLLLIGCVEALVRGVYRPHSRGSSLSAAQEERPLDASDRKELWKEVSRLEREAVKTLSAGDEAFKLLARSQALKATDPFVQLAAAYSAAEDSGDGEACARLLAAMRNTGVPPHLAAMAGSGASSRLGGLGGSALAQTSDEDEVLEEEVDLSSTFSDTVTDKIRVKVSSFFDAEKSDPSNGKYMFWYKVAVYNEGSEPVQIVARMWEIDKCRGDREVVRGAGIMSTQPIIPPGDVFTYQSVCPLKLFPPKGKRVLGSMSGAYTLCKGNMGQHNFIVKIGKFNLILPEQISVESE